MEQKTPKTPNKILAEMQIVHFGKILFALQFIALAVMLLSALSFVFVAVYYILLVCVSVLTLGSIYAAYPDFVNWWSGGEALVKFTETLAYSWKYTVPIVLALSVASVICLSFDKREKHVARIVFSVLTAIAALVVLILKLINTGVFA